MTEQTVLVVDDEDGDRRGRPRSALRARASGSWSPSDGPQAIELRRRAYPDLVVLDLMLPGMDGLEVCRRSRRGAGSRS